MQTRIRGQVLSWFEDCGRQFETNNCQSKAILRVVRKIPNPKSKMGPRPPNDEDQMPSQSLPNEESLMKPEQAAATKNDEIPDGGFAAYLQVFGAFLLFVNSW